MVDTLITGAINQRLPAPPYFVYLRQHWEDDWELQRYLWCRWIEFNASPEVDQAEFEWRFGIGEQHDQLGFAVYTPLEIDDWFVMVVVDPDNVAGTAPEEETIPVWIGRIVDNKQHDRGTLKAVEDEEIVATPQGIQALFAYGLAHELDQFPVITSQVLSGESATIEVGRGIAFNIGKGDDRDVGMVQQGNRSTGDGAGGVPVFCSRLDDSAVWNAANIVDYLLRYYSPQEPDGLRTQPWEFQPTTAQLQGLIEYKLLVGADNRTVKNILDNMFNRRRGLGWHVQVEPTEGDGVDTPQVTLICFAPTPITLSDGTPLPANESPIALDFSTDPWLESCEVRLAQLARYEQIVVRGAQRGSVFTMPLDEPGPWSFAFAGDWTNAQKDAYNAGASGAGDYATLEDADKQRRNDARRKEDDLKRVFCFFSLGVQFFGMPGEWFSGDPVNVMPEIDPATGAPNVADAPINCWIPGLRFHRHTPMLLDRDYSGDHVGNDTVGDASPLGAQPEFIPMFVGVGLPLPNVEDPTDKSLWYYARADMLADLRMRGIGDWIPTFRASCSPQQEAPGISVEVTDSIVRGGAQHMIAKNFFTPADDADAVQNLPEVDFSTQMFATVYMTCDEHAEVRVPTDDELREDLDIDRVRRLVISVPDAHLDYLAIGTVTGIKDGKLQQSDSGGWIRDDRPRLEAIAKLAASWYLEDRRTLALSFKRIYRYCHIGDLIVSIGSGDTAQTVNSVVTSVKYDLVEMKTTIETQHGELDLDGAAF